MSQNFYYNKTDHLINAQRVLEFYQGVLKDFLQRLDKEFRYKGLITNEQIEQLEQIVNQRLGQPAVLFEKALDMKEGSAHPGLDIKNEQNIELEKQEVKEEYDEANNDYLVASDVRIKDKDEEEDFNDDLVDYQAAIDDKNHDGVISFKPTKTDVEVKKEDHPEPYQEKKPQSEKYIKEENESDASEEEISTEECYRNMNSILLSTFSTPSLKHKPKEEKILVNLDNTFLKSVYYEYYIGQVHVDIQKIEKTEIRRDFPVIRAPKKYK